MNTIAEILDTLGGITASAAKLKLPLSTVASWKARSSIPIEHWPLVIETLEDAGKSGVTLDHLARMHLGLPVPVLCEPERQATAE